jgi:hypothetical protein
MNPLPELTDIGVKVKFVFEKLFEFGLPPNNWGHSPRVVTLSKQKFPELAFEFWPANRDRDENDLQESNEHDRIFPKGSESDGSSPISKRTSELPFRRGDLVRVRGKIAKFLGKDFGA